MSSSEDNSAAIRFSVDDNDRYVFESLEKNILLPKRYKFVRPIGSGGGGMVMYSFFCAGLLTDVCRLAQDLNVGDQVAIKKIHSPFSGQEMSKRCLREIYLLRTIGHPNIISLRDAFLLGSNPDLYFVMNFMPMDLRKRLSNQKPLPPQETKRYAYQLFSALAYLHHRGVVHRDLKPENLLIDPTGRLIICDLGLARPADLHMTGYVSTRFYRAPEIMLSWKNYSESVDIWSAGCIISEMLTGHVLFPGVDHVHHINLILELLGTPNEAVLDRICGQKTKSYLMMLPKSDGLDFRKSLFDSPQIPDTLVDLMRRILVMDSIERITAVQALQHPYFDGVRDLDVYEQPIADTPTTSYDPTGFDKLSHAELHDAIIAEVALFPSSCT